MWDIIHRRDWGIFEKRIEEDLNNKSTSYFGRHLFMEGHKYIPDGTKLLHTENDPSLIEIVFPNNFYY